MKFSETPAWYVIHSRPKCEHLTAGLMLGLPDVETYCPRIKEIHIGVKVGDTVELSEGPMRGLKGIVNSIHSGEERIKVLMEFLGRESLVEVNASKLLGEHTARDALASAAR